MEGKPDWLSGFPVQIYCNRSDGRLPYEKQLSPPQAALDSAAPYRGAFQTAVSPKPPLQGEVGAPEGADGGAPGGKESLRDSSEPFGRPIPTCGSGSEFDRETG